MCGKKNDYVGKLKRKKKNSFELHNLKCIKKIEIEISVFDLMKISSSCQ